MKILILCHQNAPEIDRTLPNDVVSCTTKTKLADMGRIRRELPEVLQECLGELLVEEHPHGQAAGVPRVRRSRSAA